jgi:hypothetical protein
MTEDGVTQVDALGGPLLDTILHEVAHAMFDMLRVPARMARQRNASITYYALLTVPIRNCLATSLRRDICRRKELRVAWRSTSRSPMRFSN